jgi:lipopolysaccharide export system protein LptA
MTTYSAQSIVFIDSRVPDLQDLLDGVEPGDLVFVLDPNSDGVQQIADTLAANNLTGLASISIVAHGAPGEIEIGSTLLDDANLASHSTALSEIGASMAPGGNLLLFGCDVGSGAAGTQFINDLSSLTSGTVVGAATHDVGSAADGGTWTLDASTGTLTQCAPFTSAALNSFQGLLPVAGTVELWVASTEGGNGNGLFHADDTGTGTASNTTTLFTPSSANNPTGVSQLVDVALDTQDGAYFLDFSDDGSGKWIVQAPLSQALASPGATPTFTTLYHDTSASQIEGIAPDDANQKLYFIEGNKFERLNYNAANQAPTTLGTAADVSGGPAFIDGMALDTSHNAAYFYTNQVTTTAEFTGPSSSIVIFNSVAKENGLYIDSNINNTGTTLTQLPIFPDDLTTDGNNFPTALGLISGIAVDKVHQILYFTTDELNGGTGGIYKYNLTNNSLGTYSAVWLEPPTATQVLSYISVNPTTGKYYVSDDANGDHQVLVGDLSSTLAPTTFLTLPTGAAQLEPLGLALDNAPTLALTASNATWTEEGANASIGASATVTDPDNTSLVSAAVSITSGLRAGDTLTFSTAGTSITGSYNSSTGVLTLSGLDSVADYQTVLDSVQYHGGENPTDFSRTDTSRTVTWTVNDGLLTSAPQTASISVVFVNDPPTLSGLTTASWTEEGAAATLSSGASVSDPDDLGLSSATVAITGGTFVGDSDVLATNVTGTNITASYNAATETLTLSGSDTLAHYQSVLDKVTFSAGENPTNFGADPTRTVTWTLTDPSGTANGGLATSTTTSTINVVRVNDAPTLTNVAASAQYTEEGPATTLSSAVTVTDPDDLNLSSATVKITGGTFAGDADVLAANVTGTNITASYNSTTETLTLAGSDTLANYQNVLDSVTFSAGENPNDFGSNPTRTITWQVNDGGGTASNVATTTVGITNVNDQPTLSNVASSASFTQGGGAVTLSGAASASDPDNLTLVAATVAITGGSFVGDGDVLAANTTGTSITASYNALTETLTLTGADTLAHYSQVLDSVTFNSTSGNPTDFGSFPSRTVTWVLNDGSGSFNLSTAATETVNIIATNQAPTLTGVAASAAYTEEGAATTLSGNVTVSDPDDTTLSSATVSITGGTFAGDSDLLSAAVAGTNITASYNASSETLTLTGSDTLANYQAVLDSVTFSAGENPNDFGSNPTRTVTWVLNDGHATNNLSTAQTETLSITNVNDQPTLSNVAASANFTQGGGAVTLSGAASASDPDNLTLAGATVSITGGTFAGDGDVLAANVAGTSITASYNAATELLTLTGTDTLAHYNQVLDSVTFNSTSGNPTNFGANPTRTVTWVVNDGSGSFNLSTVQTETINITNVNDAPSLTGVAASASYTEEGAATTLSGNVTVSDPDDATLSSATVSITGGKFAGDADLLATSVSGTSITASYDSTNERLVLSGTDTLAHYQSVLDKVTFSAGENPNDYGSNPTRTLTWVLNDGHASNNLSTAQTETLSITNVNDQPTLANVAATVGFLPHHTITISPSIAVSDPDNLTLANATVRITSGTFAGDGDVLGANVSGTNITAIYNPVTETLTLSGSDTLAHYQSVLDSVTFSSGNNPSQGNLHRTRTVTWVVNDGSGSNNLSTAATTTISIAGSVRNDFNGDGASDFLFQKTSSNHPDVMVELLNGTTITASGTISPPSGTAVEAMGDFNSDGKSDIVVQASDGTPQIWLMNGTVRTSTVTLTNPGSAWHAIAAADFNSDGNTDLLFQNQDGSTAVWLMNGTSVVSMTTVGNPGTSWRAIGAGDFNADGNADILFQNVDNNGGTPLIWEMNGTSIIAQATLPNIGKAWTAIGTGDFNNDGMSDILFQNKDGTPQIWEMNGTSILTQATLANPGSTWNAIGTGDFNGDGMADILFQNNDGTPLVWKMNGTSVVSTATYANPGSAWVLQDDGPIPANQMGAGGGAVHLSAPDNTAFFGAGDNGLAGSPQLDNQHPLFGHA